MRAFLAKPSSNKVLKRNRFQAKGVPVSPVRHAATFSIGAGLLQRKTGCACGGGCPRCKGELPLQTKLKIGSPNDKYEKEADRVTDQVMRIPESQVQQPEEEGEEQLVQTKPLAGQMTSVVQRQVEEEEEEETLQAKDIPGQTPKGTPELASRIQSLRGGGQPLPRADQAYFEPRVGYDFSHVRIHTDTPAAELSKAMNARAFTLGHNIVFGTGQYSPSSIEGKRLLAHELTHVVQQEPSGQTSLVGPSRMPTISSHTSSQPTINRKADVEETANQLAEQNKKPKDLDTRTAAEIGREVLETIGYEELINLAKEAGLVQDKAGGEAQGSIQTKPLSLGNMIYRQAAAVAGAITFGEAFTPYAVSAGVASQLDSPAPGPGDLVALGILAVGLIAAGITVLMASQHGRGNVADTGIMQEVQRLIEAVIKAGTTLTVCAALAQLAEQARSARDKAKLERIITTQKAKGCRPSRRL